MSREAMQVCVYWRPGERGEVVDLLALQMEKGLVRGHTPHSRLAGGNADRHHLRGFGGLVKESVAPVADIIGFWQSRYHT